MTGAVDLDLWEGIVDDDLGAVRRITSPMLDPLSPINLLTLSTGTFTISSIYLPSIINTTNCANGTLPHAREVLLLWGSALGILKKAKSKKDGFGSLVWGRDMRAVVAVLVVLTTVTWVAAACEADLEGVSTAVKALYCGVETGTYRVDVAGAPAYKAAGCMLGREKGMCSTPLVVPSELPRSPPPLEVH